MDRVFKNTVLASTVIMLLYWFLPYINYANLSQEAYDILSWNGYGSSIPSNEFIYWGLLFSWLSINIGLFFFIRPFKIIFTVFVVATTILSFFWGIAIQPPIEFILVNLLSMLDGAMLVMLYFTSVSNAFKNKP